MLGLILLTSFFNFQNNSVVVTEYDFKSDNIPKNFNGYKIVQLSDLHSKSFGKNQIKLITKVQKPDPDIIVLTGDLVDSKNYNEKISLVLMEELIGIAPVYYVTGNHEWWSGTFDSLEDKLQNVGIHILRNTIAEIKSDDDKIYLLGIDDPEIKNGNESEQAIAEEALQSFKGVGEEKSINILLSHRPELLSLYAQFNMDIVLSGHAHGGQFRFPFVGDWLHQIKVSFRSILPENMKRRIQR